MGGDPRTVAIVMAAVIPYLLLWVQWAVEMGVVIAEVEMGAEVDVAGAMEVVEVVEVVVMEEEVVVVVAECQFLDRRN